MCLVSRVCGNRTQEWDKLWTINKKIIDPVAPRHTAVALAPAPVRLTIQDGPAEQQEVETPLHKKNPDVGTKTTILARVRTKSWILVPDPLVRYTLHENPGDGTKAAYLAQGTPEQ